MSDVAPTTFTLCRLVFETTAPLAVIASRSTQGINRPIATTPWGDPWVPASGIAGALREHLGSVGLDAVHYMGGMSDHSDDGLQPSMIRVVHTALSGVTTPTELGQTRIDSRTGAAAQGSLRTSQQIPAGTRIDVDLLIDGQHSPDSELVDALARWTPRVGSGATNGMGTTRTVAISIGTLDLTAPDDLSMWIGHGGPELFAAVATEPVTPESNGPATTVTVTCTIVDPLLIAPTRTGNTATSGTTLPGSSIKGVVRHRAEFILQSLANDESLAPAVAQAALDHIFGASDRRGRLQFSDAPVLIRDREERPHVAIDRFTGGGIDGRLFSEEVIASGQFTLTITALDELDQWEIDLLDAVLVDIDDGFVAFGARTARGFGTVTLAERPAMPDLGTVVDALREFSAREELSNA